MAIVLHATWISQPGEEQAVRDILSQLAPASRQEPGNICFQVYHDPADPGTYRIFEMYVDDDALTAHSQSEHFQTWVVDHAIRALKHRHRDVFYSLDV